MSLISTVFFTVQTNLNGMGIFYITEISYVIAKLVILHENIEGHNQSSGLKGC